MDEFDPDLRFISPAIVSLSPFTPIPLQKTRRLSSSFTLPSRPIPSDRQLAHVSLKGRLVNAEEASSSKAIGGGLSKEQAAAWELFTPVQRFLIVAVIGVAAAESKKNREIWRLKNAVQLRDKVLSSMQQELDNLCEQVTACKDLPGTGAEMSFSSFTNSTCNKGFGNDSMEFVVCGCWLCDQHRDMPNLFMGDCGMKPSGGQEMLQDKMPFTLEAEQDERRMSDLSDWASSVTSAAELQMSSIALEQDIYNLQSECDKKDGTIKELKTIINSSDFVGSKRIAELEDIIRRKNLTITRLKKDMMVLEQKVVQLTRLRRPSSSLDSNFKPLPTMSDNLLYNMDSTTSPSSSDSDSSPVNQLQIPVPEIQKIPAGTVDISSKKKQYSTPARISSSLGRSTERRMKSLHASPLKEISINHRPDKVSSLRQTQQSADGDFKRSRRRTQTKS